MKSILVTGATGFVGSHTLAPLLALGFQVHALYSKRVPEFQQPNIHWHQINLHNIGAMHALLNQIQASHLLHLAWYAKPVDYWTAPQNMEWITTSINLLKEFIKTGGKRAVFVGTCAEYDWQFGYCKEFLTPCIPNTIYGQAKHALHLLSESIAQSESFSFAWARLFFLFGANESSERLIPAAIDHLMKQKEFHIKNGELIRDFMYVADAGAALSALVNTSVKGPVNIASGKPMTIRELVTRIGYLCGAEKFIAYNEYLASKIKNSIVAADITRLFDEVNWQPQYTIDTALQHTISWWNGRH